MGFVRIILDDDKLADEVKKVFSGYEDFFDLKSEFTFFGDQDEVAEKYAELCKKFPKDRISMSYDDDEGFITYYDNEDGWGHEDWIESYDVEEE